MLSYIGPLDLFLLSDWRVLSFDGDLPNTFLFFDGYSSTVQTHEFSLKWYICFTEMTHIYYLCFLIIKLFSLSVKMINKYCQRMTWNCEKEIQAIYATTLTVVEHISTHSLTVNKLKWKQWNLTLTTDHH